MKMLCGLWLFWVLPAAAAEVLQITWPTQNASPPATVSGQAAQLMPAFRVALQNLPEGMIVSLALSQPAILGLSAGEAKTLQPLVAERYKAMAADAVYRAAPSALSYCFSPVRMDHGLANVHVPDGYGSQSPVIVFLHGYGGSFLWYQHYLAQHFPKHLIICPAYGITPSAVPASYITECLAAVEKRLGRLSGKPWLLGLSAGGFGACRVFTDLPGRFAGLICIAAYPLSRQNEKTNSYFLAGGDEVFVKNGQFQRLVGNAKSHLIPGAGHFFLLTHEQESVAKLNEWLNPVAR
ncbi:MAG: alpha/beta hydrolase [Prosthecobacter sp.]